MINDDTADRLYAELEVLEDVLNGEWSAVRRALRAQSHAISEDMSKRFPDDLDYWTFRFSLGFGGSGGAPLFQLYAALKSTFLNELYPRD